MSIRDWVAQQKARLIQERSRSRGRTKAMADLDAAHQEMSAATAGFDAKDPESQRRCSEALARAHAAADRYRAER